MTALYARTVDPNPTVGTVPSKAQVLITAECHGIIPVRARTSLPGVASLIATRLLLQGAFHAEGESSLAGLEVSHWDAYADQIRSLHDAMPQGLLHPPPSLTGPQAQGFIPGMGSQTVAWQAPTEWHYPLTTPPPASHPTKRGSTQHCPVPGGGVSLGGYGAEALGTMCDNTGGLLDHGRGRHQETAEDDAQAASVPGPHGIGAGGGEGAALPSAVSAAAMCALSAMGVLQANRARGRERIDD